MMRPSESPDAHTVKPSSHQRLNLCKLSQRNASPPRIAVPITARPLISRKAAAPYGRSEYRPVSTTALRALHGFERNISGHYVARLALLGRTFAPQLT